VRCDRRDDSNCGSWCPADCLCYFILGIGRAFDENAKGRLLRYADEGRAELRRLDYAPPPQTEEEAAMIALRRLLRPGRR